MYPAKEEGSRPREGSIKLAHGAQTSKTTKPHKHAKHRLRDHRSVYLGRLPTAVPQTGNERRKAQGTTEEGRRSSDEKWPVSCLTVRAPVAIIAQEANRTIAFFLACQGCLIETREIFHFHPHIKGPRACSSKYLGRRRRRFLFALLALMFSRARFLRHSMCFFSSLQPLQAFGYRLGGSDVSRSRYRSTTR